MRLKNIETNNTRNKREKKTTVFFLSENKCVKEYDEKFNGKQEQNLNK